MKSTTRWTILIISIIIIQSVWEIFYKKISWQLNLILSVIWVFFIILLFRWMDKRASHLKELPLKERGEQRLKLFEEWGGLTIFANVMYFVGFVCVGMGFLSLLFPDSLGDNKWAVIIVFGIMGLILFVLGYFIKKSSLKTR